MIWMEHRLRRDFHEPFGNLMESLSSWKNEGIHAVRADAILILAIACSALFECKINRLARSHKSKNVVAPRYVWFAIRVLFVKKTVIPKAAFAIIAKIKNNVIKIIGLNFPHYHAAVTSSKTMSIN